MNDPGTTTLQSATANVGIRNLGKSGIAVSEIGVGCWAIGGTDWNLGMPMGWGGSNDQAALNGLRCAKELGANHFDTADVYGHGHSERLLGSFLKEVHRSHVVIGTKVGYFHGCAPHAYHPTHMRHQLEMSLTNLRTDYIDIYYFHHLDFGPADQYLPGAVDLMLRFKSEGKIRAIGQRGPHQYAPSRNSPTVTGPTKYQRFLDIAHVVQPDVVQTRYNMLSSQSDILTADIFHWAETQNVGIVINKPLAQGLLLDKYNPDSPPTFPDGDHRNKKRWFQATPLAVLRSRLAQIKARFGDSTESLASVALQYCLTRSPNAAVVVGFKNADQVTMNLSARQHRLTCDERHFICDVMSGIGDDLGPFFSLEQPH